MMSSISSLVLYNWTCIKGFHEGKILGKSVGLLGSIESSVISLLKSPTVEELIWTKRRVVENKELK